MHRASNLGVALHQRYTLVCPNVLRLSACGLLLVGVLLLPPDALAQTSPFMTGATALQTNIVILRCSSSEQGGTSHFASRLIGEREIRRKQVTKNLESPFIGGRPRRSRNLTEQHVTETAVLASEIEQLPDLCGYFKRASAAHWLKVSFAPRAPRAPSARVRH